MGAGDHGARGQNGAGETEGLVDVADVVVDGLGNGDDADGQLAPLDLHGDVVRAAAGAVAADAEQHVDVHAGQGIDDDAGVLVAPGGAENGPARLVDVIDHFGRELDGGEAVDGIQPLVAVADAVDHGNAVAVDEREREELDDLVQTGAESARGEDGGLAPRRIVKDLRPGSGLLEGGDGLSRGNILRDGPRVGLVAHRGVVRHEHVVFEGRRQHGLAEAGYLEIIGTHFQLPCFYDRSNADNLA